MNSPTNAAPQGGAGTEEKPMATSVKAGQKKSPQSSGGVIDKFLNGVEYIGNKLPEPFTIFLILFLITAVLSTIMAWMGVEVKVPGTDEVQPVKGLFTGEGLAWITTTMGENYINFPPLVTVLPIMLAVGVAERSGMLSALIRKLFGSAKP